MIHAPNDTLQAWFDVYHKNRIPDAGYCTLKHWRQSIRWFADALGRPATIFDLKLDVVVDAMEKLRGKLSLKSVDVFANKVAALWRFLAHNHIVDAWPPYPRFRVTTAGIDLPPQRTVQKLRKGKLTGQRKNRKQWAYNHDAKPVQPTIEVPAVLTPETPLRVLAEAYKRRRLPGKNPNTAGRFIGAVRALERFLERPAVIADLTDENVLAVVAAVFARGRTISTAKGEQKKLVALWNFAFKRGILKMAPDLPTLKEPRRVRAVLMPDEIQRLFQAIRRSTRRNGKIPAADWFLGLVLVMFDSAERVGALLQVRWTDLQTRNGETWLIVPAEVRKWKTEDMPFKLSFGTVAILQRIKAKSQSELIFPWYRDRHTLHSWWKRILKAADLPQTREYGFHCIRRTVASLYQQAGHDASKLLGHSTPEITRVYLSPLIVQTPQPSDVLKLPAPEESK